jgi:hypothetical protein
MQRQNLGGWSDLWARAHILMRFYERYQDGKDLVFLWCGDLDPGGECISDFLRNNFLELAPAVAGESGVDADDIEQMIEEITFDRFGLNADFTDITAAIATRDAETAANLLRRLAQVVGLDLDIAVGHIAIAEAVVEQRLPVGRIDAATSDFDTVFSIGV